MKIYAIYCDTKDNKDIYVVKQGFNFIAAIFHFFWALFQKLWGIFLFGIIISVIIIYMEEYIPSTHIIFECVIILFFGFFADDLMEFYLLKKGYKLVRIIAANNEIEAQSKYYLTLDVL